MNSIVSMNKRFCLLSVNKGSKYPKIARCPSNCWVWSSILGASIDAFDINFSSDAIFYLFWCSIRQTSCLPEYFWKVDKAHPDVLTAESIVNDPFFQWQFSTGILYIQNCICFNVSKLSKIISSNSNWKPGNETYWKWHECINNQQKMFIFCNLKL